MTGDTPPDYRGPTMGGDQTEVDWERQGPRYQPHEDHLLRASLSQAQLDLLHPPRHGLRSEHHVRSTIQAHEPRPPCQIESKQQNPADVLSFPCPLIAKLPRREKTFSISAIPKTLWPAVCNMSAKPKQASSNSHTKLPRSQKALCLLPLSLRTPTFLNLKENGTPVPCAITNKTKTTFLTKLYPNWQNTTSLKQPTNTNPSHKQESARSTSPEQSKNKKTSILGPHPHTYSHLRTFSYPAHIPPYSCTKHQSPHRNKPNHTLFYPSTASVSMDPSDEALIKKFAGLQTCFESGAPSAKIIIPQNSAPNKNWDLCLKATVCTDRMVFPSQFEGQMRKSWDVSPDTAFKQMERGIYLIEFVDMKEKQRVLNDGPWVYRQDLVAVEQCKSLEDLAKEITDAELWVQFHNLHIE